MRHSMYRVAVIVTTASLMLGQATALAAQSSDGDTSMMNPGNDTSMMNPGDTAMMDHGDMGQTMSDPAAEGDASMLQDHDSMPMPMATSSDDGTMMPDADEAH